MATTTVHPKIRQKCETCFDSFSRAFRSAETFGGRDSYCRTIADLQDKFAQFRLWTRHVGVFAEPQLSLDFRVRDVGGFKDLFLDHLDVIACRLIQLIELISEDSNDDVGMNDDDMGIIGSDCQGDTAMKTESNQFTSWTPNELLQSISQSLAWLQRLSNSIQEAISGYQAAEVNSFNIQQYTGDQRLSENAIRDYYTQLIPTISPDLEEKRLIDRLVNTMILRLKRILHRRSRQVEWLFPHAKEPLPYATGSQSSSPHRISSQPMTKANTGMPVVPVTSDGPHEELSSMLDRTKTFEKLGNYNFWKDATFGIPDTDDMPAPDNLDTFLPYAPESFGTCQEFKCPYCGLVLPSDVATSERAWREHIRLDLEPYICIFADCNESLETYTTEVEWMSHMRSAHCTKWRCVAPHADGKSFIAVTLPDFQLHMTEAHPGKHSDDELSLISNISRTVVSPTFDHCPFCSDHEMTPGPIERHVAGHLRHFALRSLDIPTEAVARKMGHAHTFEVACTPREMETKLLPLKRLARGMNATAPQSHSRPAKRLRVQFGRGNLKIEEENDNEDASGRERPWNYENNRSLACPYFKKDRRVYASCCDRRLSRIRDVKQHLKRRHYLPIYCSCCNEVFADEKVRDQHANRRNCERGTWPQPEGVSLMQQQELNRRANRQLPEDEQWHGIFRILFPDAPRPSSAYIDPSLSDSALAYQEYVTARGPEILRRTLVESGAVAAWNETNVDDVDNFLRHILGRGLGAIAKAWAEETAPVAAEVTPSEGESLEMVNTGDMASASSAFHSSSISTASMADYSDYARSYPDAIPWSGQQDSQYNQIPDLTYMDLLDEEDVDEMQRILFPVPDMTGVAAWQNYTHGRPTGG